MSRPNIFEKVIDALNRSGCRYVVVASIDSLIKMKKIADRDQDRLDIKMLEQIRQKKQRT